MNKRFLIAWAVVLIVWFFGSFLVHGVLLAPDYKGLGALFRTDADAAPYFPLMLLAHVMLAGAFVWIYARGVEAKPWLGQGLRFGIAVAFLTTIPTYTIYFVVQPMPGGVVIRQILFDGVLLLVLGAITGWLYRDGKA
jgi:hypothetical protein